MLYFRGSESHSSLFGGIVTAALGVIFSIMAIFIIWQTIQRNKFIMSEEFKDMKKDPINITIGDYITKINHGRIFVAYSLNS